MPNGSRPQILLVADEPFGQPCECCSFLPDTTWPWQTTASVPYRNLNRTTAARVDS